MLMITSRQVQLLDVAAGARQDARMAQVIAQAMPDLAVELDGEAREARFLEWIDLGCESAAKLGIDEPGDMAVVIALHLARTQLTEQERERLRQWTSALLQRKGSSGRLKVALVEFALQRQAVRDELAKRLFAVMTRVRAAYRH
jgi:hypothetical protein